MVRRVLGPIALLVAIGTLAIGAVAYAAGAVSSNTVAPAKAPVFHTMPAAAHHGGGPCPNMGGSSGSSGSGASSSDSSV
jgi:hypothetical protein